MRLAGLEPANLELSLLLIIAFLCIYLQIHIRHFPCVCKYIRALMGNEWKMFVCQAVSEKPAVSICVSVGNGAECVSELCQRFSPSAVNAKPQDMLSWPSAVLTLSAVKSRWQNKWDTQKGVAID